MVTRSKVVTKVMYRNPFRFTLLYRRYNHLWALLWSRIWLQCGMSFNTFCQLLISSARKPDSTPFIHLIFGHPIPLRPFGSFRIMLARCPTHLNYWTFPTATISGLPKSRFSSKLYRHRAKHFTLKCKEQFVPHSTSPSKIRAHRSDLYE